MTTDANGFEIVGSTPPPETSSGSGVDANGFQLASAPTAPRTEAVAAPSSGVDANGFALANPSPVNGQSGAAPAEHIYQDKAQPWYKRAFDFAETPVTESIFGLPETRPGAGGFEKGAERILSGFTSPLSLGLTAATFGGGSILESAGANLLKQTGLFTAEQLPTIVKASEAALEASKALKPLEPVINSALEREGGDALVGLVNKAKDVLGPVDLSSRLGEENIQGILTKNGFSEDQLGQLSKASKTIQEAKGGFTPVEDAVKSAVGDDGYNLWKQGQDVLHSNGLTEHDLIGGNALERGAFQILRKTIPTMSVASAATMAKTANALLSAGFTFQQLETAAAMSPRFLDALKEGDWESAKEYGTEAAAGAAFGLLGTPHALHAAGELFKPILGTPDEPVKFRPNDQFIAVQRAAKDVDANSAVGNAYAKEIDDTARQVLGHSGKPTPEQQGELAAVYHHVVTGGDADKAGAWYNALSEAAGRDDRVASPLRQSEIPRTYDAVQKEIDAAEDALENSGAQISKLYFPENAEIMKDAPGWKPMPENLVKLYEERDAIGSEQLKESISDITDRLKTAGITDKNEVRRILAKYTLDPDSTGGTKQYLAAEHTPAIVEDPIKRQVEEAYIALATQRGIPMDNMDDVFRDPKTTEDAKNAVKAVISYFKRGPEETRKELAAPPTRPVNGLPDDIASKTQNSAFAKQPKDYQDLILNSLKKVAIGDLSEKELAASKYLRDQDARNYEIGSANDLLHSWIPDHIHRVYEDENPDGRIVTSNAKQGRFSTNVSQARHQVYDSHLVALLKSPKKIVMDPIQSVAQDRVDLVKAAANRQFIDTLRDNFTRGSDGRPAVVLSGAGRVIQGPDGTDPKTFISPDRVRKLNISDSVIQHLSRLDNVQVGPSEHVANGITYRSTPSSEGNIHVEARRADGTKIGEVDLLRETGFEGAFTSGVEVPQPLRGQGIATELYRQLPAIAKRYGISRIMGEGAQLEGGKGIWSKLAREGLAKPIDMSQYGESPRLGIEIGQRVPAGSQLERFLDDGTIKDITPRIKSSDVPDTIARLEKQAESKPAQYDESGNNKLRTDIMYLKSMVANNDFSGLKDFNDAQKKNYVFDPQDYISLEHPSMKAWKFATSDPAGNPIFVNSDIRVHPEFAEYIKNRLGLEGSALQQNPISKFALGVGTKLKETLLSFSPFHALQIMLRGVMTGVSPFTLEAPDLLHGEKIDPADPNSPTILKKLVEQGYTTGTDYRGLQDYTEGVSSGGGLIKYIPIIGKPLANAMNWQSDMIFKRLIPAVKSDAGIHMFHEYQRLHPDWSIDRAAKAAAIHSNRSFGGINFKAMGRSATSEDVLRAVTLAPDWIESEISSGAALFNKEEGGLQRAQVVKMAFALWGIARVLNYAATGSFHPEAPFGLATRNKDGKEIIYSIRTLPGDLLHAASDPVSFIKGRFSPTFRTVEEAATQRDQFGRKMTPEDTFVDVMRNMLPIPGQSIGQAVSGTGPSVGNIGQFVKAVGGTAQTYQTPAQKLASELAANHEESGPVDEAQLARHRQIINLEDGVRSGKVSWPELYQMTYQTNQLHESELKKIQQVVKNTKEMDPSTATLYSRASRLPAKEYFDLYGQMNPSERIALIPLTKQVMRKYLSKSQKDMTPQERATDPLVNRIVRMLPQLEAQQSTAQ